MFRVLRRMNRGKGNRWYVTGRYKTANEALEALELEYERSVQEFLKDILTGEGVGFLIE